LHILYTMTADVLGIRGKPALVVGGGAGIGRASAFLLAAAGADVVVADLDPDRAASTSKEIQDLGVTSYAVAGDVTDRQQAEGIVAEATKVLGSLEIVINMVGMATWTLLEHLDDDSWSLDIARNLTHHLYVGRAASREMMRQGTGGRIAVVASVSGIYGAPSHGAYGAAKAGVMALVRTMAQEWGPHGIRVNAVAPDMISTPRFPDVDLDSSARQDGMPMGRAGHPEEIAGPLVFLVSDLSSFMTGQTLIVDGGQRAAFPHWRYAFAQADG
jgi:NAD(P)-dependent dehydrogenase (short-subunit alcohol dehydrogenase family)